MSTVKPFRLGIIGVAGIGGSHRSKLLELPGTELGAICDINAEVLGEVGERWNVPHRDRHHRLEELLERDDLDAVSVCTPNFAHVAPTIAALRAGKHVLVEKPMAMTVAEARTMVEASEECGRKLVVGFQWRFDSRARFLRAQVAAGSFGRIHHVRVQALRRRMIPSWGVFTDKEKQGGGALIDWGVHLLEMAHFIVGCPEPVTASAQTWSSIGTAPCAVACAWGPWKHERYSVEDLLVGFVRFADGSTLSIETSFAAHIDQNLTQVQIMGSEGGGVFDPPQVYADRNGYQMTSSPEFLPEVDPFLEKMRHFVEVCRDGRRNEASGEDGLAVQQIIEGLYRSAESNREVALDEPAYRRRTTAEPLTAS